MEKNVTRQAYNSQTMELMDVNPQFSRADRHLAHILIEDAARQMREQVLLTAINILMNEGEALSLFTR